MTTSPLSCPAEPRRMRFGNVAVVELVLAYLALMFGLALSSGLPFEVVQPVAQTLERAMPGIPTLAHGALVIAVALFQFVGILCWWRPLRLATLLADVYLGLFLCVTLLQHPALSLISLLACGLSTREYVRLCRERR